ncbi:hypothetical protein TWF696_002289 [Orbilia brochopaga]|uniref:Zn(2)-C6 fungal-type domain-containing protein n=1 Tax=Orbilia brochopaga TaxID=3140254 RepID=A0AAV9U5Y6_9PEZI
MIMVDYTSSHPDSRPASVHGSSRYQPHISSPHLQHLEHRPSPHSTPSPTFSYAQPPLQNRQNITSYPSPGSYPSPSMSSYSSYPPQPGSARDSPTYSAASLPGVGSSSFALPPIRLAPPTSSPTLQVGSPLPAPAPSLPGMQGYYSMPSERIMSGGRHKKEIKRRTKTGCLTCRKRRIKCDEAHPTCKNCAKSKRECLGYDPIFKQAPQGPPPIQPAPASTPPSLAPAAYGVSPGPSLPMPHSHPHQMQMPMPMPIPSMQHHHMPTSVPIGYMTGSHTLSTNGSSPRSTQYDFEYGGAIDPSLESATLPPPVLSPMIGERILQSDANGFRDLKRSYDRGSSYPPVSDTPRTSGTPIPRSATPGASGYHSFRDDLSSGNPAKRIKIDDLIVGAAPPPPTPPPSENAYIPGNEGVRALYNNKYAPALDQLLETGWFTDECVTIMSLNMDLVSFLGTVFDRLNSGDAPSDSDAGFDHLPPGKAALILYTVMDLLYGLRRKGDGSMIGYQPSRNEDNISETLDRVKIIETLVMNRRLEDDDEPSRLSLADFHPDEESPDVRSTRFWGAIKMFLKLQDFGSPAARDILEACRPYLERNLDNRDIIYSIAAIRHLQDALRDDRDDTYPDPDEKRRKLTQLDDAKSFIESMARTPSGEMTCVFRRICSRALALFQRKDANQGKVGGTL